MTSISSRLSLLALFLAGNTVVAGDVKHPANRQNAMVAPAQGVSTAPTSPVSATEAASVTTVSPLSSVTATNALPPLPPGVMELKFNEFFRSPVGPRGLEFTDKLRNLEGRRIRILGYMVQQAKPTEHCFLLANRPIMVNEAEYGLCDDLPASTLHVLTTADALAKTPFTPGPMLLTGTLSVSNRVEADGRVSAVRLFLDAPTPEQRLLAVQAAEALAHQPDPHAGHHH